MGVAWVRRDRLPGVSLSLVLPVGADSAGVECAGTASLVGKLLPEGAAGRSAREMALWIDGLGAHVGVAVGYDAIILSVNTLSDLLEDVLEVLAAVALEPDFLPAEVERCRGERLDAIRRLKDDPADVAADVLAELMYGTHPYGRLARGPRCLGRAARTGGPGQVPSRHIRAGRRNTGRVRRSTRALSGTCRAEVRLVAGHGTGHGLPPMWCRFPRRRESFSSIAPGATNR